MSISIGKNKFDVIDQVVLICPEMGVPGGFCKVDKDINRAWGRVSSSGGETAIDWLGRTADRKAGKDLPMGACFLRIKRNGKWEKEQIVLKADMAKSG